MRVDQFVESLPKSTFQSLPGLLHCLESDNTLETSRKPLNTDMWKGAQVKKLIRQLAKVLNVETGSWSTPLCPSPTCPKAGKILYLEGIIIKQIKQIFLYYITGKKSQSIRDLLPKSLQRSHWKPGGRIPSLENFIEIRS